MGRWIGCIAGVLAAALAAAPVLAQGASDADVLRVMLIPGLEYTNLQDIRRLAATDVAVVDVHDNLAAAGLPPSMKTQMWQSYQDSKAKLRGGIDSLRANLAGLQWCRYGSCHPAPNNQLIRDALAARHLSLSNVVALDAKHGNGVAVYIEP
jgi:hypothetical protein